MVKNKTIKNKIVKNNTVKNKNNNTSKKDSSKNNVTYDIVAKVPKKDEFKKELLEVDKEENVYNKMFEKKLSEQYREFRNLKEHRLQSKKFMRMIGVLIVIILVALLLLTFG
jgi:hypothetical protein